MCRITDNGLLHGHHRPPDPQVGDVDSFMDGVEANDTEVIGNIKFIGDMTYQALRHLSYDYEASFSNSYGLMNSEHNIITDSFSIMCMYGTCKELEVVNILLFCVK